MSHHPLILADQDRLELFANLGQSRALFHDAQVWTDDEGTAWMGTRAGATGVAVTWLGPGWVFDAQARQERAEEYEARRQAMQETAKGRHRNKLKGVARRVRLGGHAERLLWAVHAAARASGTALLTLSDEWMAAAVWGGSRGPRHWRGEHLSAR